MQKRIILKFFILVVISILAMGKSSGCGSTGPTDPTCSNDLCVYVPDYTTDCGNTLYLNPQVTTNATIIRVEWDFGELPVEEIQYDSTRLYPTLINVGNFRMSFCYGVYGVRTFTISLTVENSNGVIAIDGAVITVCGTQC